MAKCQIWLACIPRHRLSYGEFYWVLKIFFFLKLIPLRDTSSGRLDLLERIWLFSTFFFLFSRIAVLLWCISQNYAIGGSLVCVATKWLILNLQVKCSLMLYVPIDFLDHSNKIMLTLPVCFLVLKRFNDWRRLKF